MGSMLPYIAAPWILWDGLNNLFVIKKNVVLAEVFFATDLQKLRKNRRLGDVVDTSSVWDGYLGASRDCFHRCG